VKTTPSATGVGAPRRETTGAVVAAYRPDAGFADRLGRIQCQVARVIVVDNSGPSDRAIGHQLAGTDVEVVENERNLGVATALNQGLRRASELELSWAVLLDQDSVVDMDALRRLAVIYDEYPAPEKIGLLAANARSLASGKLAVLGRRSRAGYFEVETTITSGSVLALAAYRSSGPFRDDFFIEGVDLEYCLRLRRHGFRILCSRDALMTHAGGQGLERSFLGRTVVVGDHEPWRYYYMLRNFVEIVRLYFCREPLWVLRATTNFVKTFIKIGLYERHKSAKFAAIARGVGDGIAGSWRGRAGGFRC